jgi:peptidoglycan/xylan/chitin deacetylase (PgdA/CDA1 family)
MVISLPTRVAAAGAALIAAVTILAMSTVPGPAPRMYRAAPSRPGAPSPDGDDLATPNPSGSSTAPDPGLPGIPTFPPAPVPQPIVVPAGPLAPIYHRLPVTQPVAFLTIDDGWFQLPEDLAMMRKAHIPFTMFLIAPVAAKNPGFFKQLEAAGGVIEDHTVTHTSLRGAGYPFQHHEICDGRAALAQIFGTTPHLFRPPFGNYDQTTLRAVHDCGLQAAFYWSETVNNGVVAYQTADHRIQAGDIILMHFRPAFVKDVLAALTAIHNAGLTPALLEDYIA